jgi:hypothetical protein
MSIHELKALARKHWAEWLPEKVRELKAEGRFNEELHAAANLAQTEIEHLMKQGYSVDEAREVALPQFILLPPEEQPPDEQDEELAEKEREYQRVYGKEEEQGDPNEGFLPSMTPRTSTPPLPEKTGSSKPLARLPTPSEAEEMTTRYMSEGIEEGARRRREREALNKGKAPSQQPPAYVVPDPPPILGNTLERWERYLQELKDGPPIPGGKRAEIAFAEGLIAQKRRERPRSS